MPAKSQAQQKLFAIAEHNPSILRGKNKKLAKLPKKTLHEFAATKRKGLPKHKASKILGGKQKRKNRRRTRK
jgi:hypothetical protein